MQLQFRWAGHVIRMSDDWMLKILMNTQLFHVKCNVGRPWLGFKDKPRYNLIAANIPTEEFEHTVGN